MIGYGCVRLTSCKTLTEAQSLINHVVSVGIRYFDTAPSYGRGYSEKILGTCLSHSGLSREEFTIATKLGGFSQKNPIMPTSLVLPLKDLQRRLQNTRAIKDSLDISVQRSSQSSPLSFYEITIDDVRTSVNRSLESLKTDYIDILLLHEALPGFLANDALLYVLDLKKSGVVRQIGIAANGSNYSSLSEDDIHDWDILQYEYGPAWPEHYSFKNKFPSKKHVLHSCLGYRRNYYLDPHDRLKEVVTDFPEATVLFSSLNKQHISANVAIAKSDFP